MAQKEVQLDRESVSCSLCLDLLKDPVTVPCEHSYCMDCIKAHWDTEEEKESYSCPQCRHTFTSRPVLLRNTMLETLLQELKKTGLQAAPEDPSYHNQFLHSYPSLSGLSGPADPSSIETRPLRYFEDVTAAVSEVRDQPQEVLRETNVSQAATEVDALLSDPPEPKTRAGFLRYSRGLTLDPNTANTHLILSDGNRRATQKQQPQSYSSHPDRFTHFGQVLSRESLSGRCYWEVEWRGDAVWVAVAYKNISRAGESLDCVFGFNDKSWMLECYSSYNFWFNKVITPVSGPQSSRVGVYLDHRAGILSFYSVSETMTLLHRVQTTFTQPLYAGLRLNRYENSAEFCELQ
ncbi:E3 ubiquitin/ISG15 ligase TRIM25-like [Notolabrus celidotus]|uniref:E3 ubiquitin/ISG15 ligase TRIM25-like n=1 Tax=Notolabrus celidotus TaxID=1203425 RepID=UPI0014904CE9|nr:E3 ubiquitin/ISG15 ligase TRIM25-like [Notolabrus celidotus]